ncbi:peptidoglycan-binding protein [Streptomyces sp. Y1]|uniref:Peptidoglycan-binding protein n=1 Tax=Streptomyces sp. Y1 TaxID=3238634 RepID=A0AB39THQ4_9ACTN
MTKPSTSQRRKALQDALKDLREADSKNDVIDAIKDALAVHAPVGDPAAIEATGNRYKTMATESEHLHRDVTTIAETGLPDVWTGTTGAKAAEVIGATGRAIDRQSTAFIKAWLTLHNLADALRAAQAADGPARSGAQQVLSQLGGKEGWFDEWFEDDDDEAKRKKAQQAAIPHVEGMLTAAAKADDAARAAARDLNRLADEARAGKLRAKGVSSADKVVLAETSGPDGPTELNDLLTANDLKRSGEYLDRMNPTDLAAFDRMLADSSTPQERAYLMKALAAGHNLDEIRAFDGKIHGKDPEWLRTHLTPVYTKSDNRDSGGQDSDGSNRYQYEVKFGSARWQQTGPTCVASTTVTARAMADPLYALDLTGGPTGQDNDPAAFQRRLLDEQNRVHEEGHGNKKGMDEHGTGDVLAKEVSPHTGATYEYKPLSDENARRAILPEIEKAVAEGKPVPVSIEGHVGDERKGHEVLIVGQEGDMLQVYNPWGRTTWISEADFANGHMDHVADNRTPVVDAVHLPK